MTIDFPATDDTQTAKLVQLLQDLGDCLETTINIETISVLRVKYDGSRIDLDSILKRLAGNKTGLIRLSNQFVDKDIDPLGS